MKMRVAKTFLLALAAATAFGAIVRAGSSPKAVHSEPVPKEIANSGRIFGFVTDPQGAIVSRADVTLMNSVTEVHQQTASDGQGYFEFDSVEPGE